MGKSGEIVLQHLRVKPHTRGTPARSVRASRARLLAAAVALTALLVWAPAATAAEPMSVGVGSRTHPDQTLWYADDYPTFVWGGARSADAVVAGYSFVLSPDPEAMVDTTTEQPAMTFAPPDSLATGREPQPLAVGHLDGDGYPDLVTANYLDDNVMVFLSDGAGGYELHGPYPVGDGPGCIAIADFTHDNKNDLAVTNWDGGTVSLLINQGGGTFVPAPTDLHAGILPWGIVSGYFNGDDLEDLAVANEGSDAVSVWLSDGDGTFGPRTDYTVAGGATALAVHDFNGDYRADVAVACGKDDKVSVLINDGAGGFLPRVDYAVGSSPLSVAVGDLGGDHEVDLAVANASSSTVSVLLGKGDGTFAAKTDYASGPNPWCVSVGDFMGDGWRDDLATADYNSGTVSVLVNRGDDRYERLYTCAAGANPVSVATWDLDWDGRDDLAVVSEGSNSIRVLRNTSRAKSYGVPDGIWYFRVRAVDATGEGGPTGMHRVCIDTTTPTTVGVVSSPTHPLEASWYADPDPALKWGGASDAGAGVAGYSFVFGQDPAAAVDTTVEQRAAAFAPLDDVATGGEPQPLASGDLNGDGDVDLVTANYLDNDVRVFLGDGVGGFDPGDDYPVGAGPGCIAIADFDNWNGPDLAVTNYDGGTVSLLMNNGDGTFTRRLPDLEADDHPWGIASADFNRDGKVDLAAANEGSGVVSVWFGYGTGAFQSRSDFYSGSGATSLAVADFDKRGGPDLAVANWNWPDENVSVLLNDGAGGFLPRTTYLRLPQLLSVATGDFDKDGSSDLAVTSYLHEGTVSVMLGKGDGTFAPATHYKSGLYPWWVTVADLSGDGVLDLVTADYVYTHSVSVMLGGGDGTFQRPYSYVTGANPVSVSARDFDNDGRLDMAVANEGSNSISVLRNTSKAVSYTGIADGVWYFRVRAIDAAGQPGPISTRAVRIDRSEPTAVGSLSSPTHPEEDTLYGNADPSFRWDQATDAGAGVAGYSFVLDQDPAAAVDTTTELPFMSFAPPVALTTGDQPQPLAADDLNGDGYVDLVTANYSDDDVRVFLGDGAGGFTARGDYPVGAGPGCIAVADFTSDGSPDLAVTNWDGGTVSLLANQGGGAFVTRASGLATGGRPWGIVTADFDGNGRADLAIANEGSGTVTVWFGVGDGTFQGRTDYTVGGGPTSLAVADFDKKNGPDLVVARYMDDMVSVLVNDGLGGLTLDDSYRVGDEPLSVAVGDLDDDDVLDLAVANDLSSNVSVLLGKGDGTFAAKTDYATGARPWWVSVADFSGDGVLDLVTADYVSARVSVLLGDGSGSFQRRLTCNTGSAPVSVAARDFDDDGRVDMAVANEGSDTISVLRNTSSRAMSYTGIADGVWYFRVRAVDAAGNGGPISTRKVCIDTTHNTLPGENVTVDLGSGAAVTFGSVDAAGSTAVTTSGTNPGTPLGVFDVLGHTYYEITTTAEYGGFIEIALPYDPEAVPPGDPQALRLLHWDDPMWVDCTTWVDTEQHIIYGVVDHLSWFAAVSPRTTSLTYSGATSGQYSDGVTLSATLESGAAGDLSGKMITFTLGSQTATAMTGPDGVAETTLTITQAPGSYPLTASFAGSEDFMGASDDDQAFTVVAEDARLTFPGENPVALKVASDGVSGSFTVSVTLRERLPDVGSCPLAGDLRNAALGLVLAPVGPGTPVIGVNPTKTVTGIGYDTTIRYVYTFSKVAVNTYAVQSTVGGHYTAFSEGVLTVYDPAKGPGSGGGRFLWANNDRGEFGFTLKPTKGGRVQGYLMAIRSLSDGSSCRMKSNVFDGAVGKGASGSTPFGWATMAGKATYIGSGWGSALGNYTFTAYAEDRSNSGRVASSPDRFWIEVKDKDGVVVGLMSMDRNAVANAVALTSGEVVVPH